MDETNIVMFIYVGVLLFVLICVKFVQWLDSGLHTKININNIDLDGVDLLEGHSFEYYCAELLRKNGYKKVEVTKGSGDQGVDIIAIKNNVKYAIQCKNYHSKIGNKAVQEVYTGKKYYKCDVAVVLTNAYFTQSAKELAIATEVLLWDRNILAELIKNPCSK